MKKLATMLLVLCGALTFLTCKSVPPQEPVKPAVLAPVIASHVMRTEARTSSAHEWVIIINIENYNSFELPPPKITFNYKIYDTSIIRSRFEHRQPLAANSSTPVIFGILVYYADVYRALPALRFEKDAPSVLELSFDFILPEFSEEKFELKIPATLTLPGF